MQVSSKTEPIRGRGRHSGDVLIRILKKKHLRAMGRLEMAPLINGYAFVALDPIDRHPIWASGIIDNVTEHRGYCWAVWGDVRPNSRQMLSISRATMMAVEGALEQMYLRVEMTVRDDDEKAKRWAEYLGFRDEAGIPLEKLMADGTPGRIYVRTSDG